MWEEGGKSVTSGDTINEFQEQCIANLQRSIKSCEVTTHELWLSMNCVWVSRKSQLLLFILGVLNPYARALYRQVRSNS